MADPTPYAPDYDFTAIEAGTFLNVELANAAEASEVAVAAIKDIRRSDGALKNGIVRAESLAPDAIAYLVATVGPEGDIAGAILIAAEASALTASNAATAADASAIGAAASAVEADGFAGAAAVSAAAAAGSTAVAEAAEMVADVSATAAEASAVAAGLAEAAAEASATAADASADAAAASADAAAASAVAAVAAAAAAKVVFVATKNGTNQTGVVTATWTKVTFSTEVFDEGGHFDTATGRWTPPAGRYRVAGQAEFAAGVVDQASFAVAIYKNGVSHRQNTRHASGTAALSNDVGAIVEANGTDYFEFWVYGGGAGNKTLDGDAARTWFEGSAL